MAADLGVTPRSGLDVQLCGDAHLSNFGAFAAPDRRLIFDINDFDETHPGPFEWDVKRLAASFEVAGRDRGFKKREGREVVTTAARAYREEMRRLAAERNIDVWYERVDIEVIEQYRSQVSRKVARNFDKAKAKAESKNSLRAFTKLTRRGRRGTADRQRPSADRPDRGARAEEQAQGGPDRVGRSGGPVPRNPLPRHPISGGPLSLRPRRPQGGRRRQRRDPLLDRPDAR